MTRILATPATVETLFEPCEVDYPLATETIKLPGWRCRACGWESLYGVHRLPWPHECQSIFTGAASVDQTFTAGTLTAL